MAKLTVSAHVTLDFKTYMTIGNSTKKWFPKKFYHVHSEESLLKCHDMWNT